MSCTLPPEILDLIVDHLHDQPTALKACCVVSKSWVPRTRKHLFARIEFCALKSSVEQWKNVFPDPSNSPAHYARTLFFHGLAATTTADPDVGSWIRTFHRVVTLRMNSLGCDDSRISLVQLHGLSPNLKSFHLIHSSLPLSEIFSFICSFPLLEDLGFYTTSRNDTGGWDIPSTSPKLTGSLRIMGIIQSAARRLCDLPGGLRFSKITVSCSKRDVQSLMDLVSRCSGTLESFSVSYYPSNMSETPPLDLSKATKLKDVEFACRKSDIQWIAMTVQTATSKSLRQITINLRLGPLDQTGERVHRELQDLDHLLVRLWTSRSIHPEVTYRTSKGEHDIKGLASNFLPELAGRGFVNVIEYG